MSKLENLGRTTSKLPHYKNSKASMNNYEPVYNNLFEITIGAPNGVEWDGDLLMDQVIKVSGLDVDKIPPAGVTQTYKGWTRSFANAKLDQSYVDIVIDFEVNLNDAHSMYAYKNLKDWCNKVFNPLTATMSLKKDYVGGPMIIQAYDREGNIFRKYTFNTVWPTTNLSTIEFDYSSTEIHRITGFTFRSDYFDDVSA